MSSGRAVYRYFPATLICLVAFLCAASAKNDASTTREPITAPKLSPEMERPKKFYLGSWDFTETYEKNDFLSAGRK
jgi:hypothetical protein